MPRHTVVGMVVLEDQAKALALLAAGGRVEISNSAGLVLVALPVASADADKNFARFKLTGKEVERKGKAAQFALRSEQGELLLKDTVGTEDAGMIVRTTDFIPGVMVDPGLFEHEIPAELS